MAWEISVVFRFRSLKTLFVSMVLSMGFAPSAHAGAEGNPKNETPTSSSVVRIGAGTVDAVSGNLQLHLPMGPRMPGRIPLGFSWNFTSQDTAQVAIGGGFRPVSWPSLNFGDSPIQTTVVVNGQPEVFYRQVNNGSMPSASDLQSALTARGFNPAQPTYATGGWIVNGTGTLRLQAIPSTDGTRFLIYYYFDTPCEKDNHTTGVVSYSTQQLAPGYAILDGSEVIWAQWNFDVTVVTSPSRHTVSHFTNLWGDHVTSDEVENPYTDANGTFWRLSSIVLTDQVKPSNTVTLTLTHQGTPTTTVQSGLTSSGTLSTAPGTIKNTGTIQVTNSLGLPTVSVTGKFGGDQRFTPPVPYSCPGYSNTEPLHPEGLWDDGFCPTSIVSTASTGSSRTLSMVWDAVNEKVSSISYSNGLKESFTYGNGGINLSSFSYSLCNGLWQGFQFRQPSNPSDGMGAIGFEAPAGVTQLTRQDTLGSGQGDESYVFLHTIPAWTTTSSGTPGAPKFTYTCTQPAHTTAILHYPAATPGGSFRAVRLTHPSYDASYDPNSTVSTLNNRACYLFASSAILDEEVITGTGTPATPEAVSGHTVQVTAYDGFDLTSWANPAGSLSSGLPVSPMALRTTVVTENLPTKITVTGNPQTSGARDAYGPIITDEYTDVPRAFPTISGTTVPGWSDALPASEFHPIHRRGTIARESDFKSTDPVPGLSRLLVKTDQKTLDGASLSSLRFSAPHAGASAGAPSSGIASANFGTTTYGYDTTGRITTQAGVRTDPVSGAVFTATDTRTYATGLPVLLTSTRTLTSTGDTQSSYAGSGETITNTWTDTHVQAGPSSTTSSIDGRIATFVYDTTLGQETSRTDVLGVTTTTTYDAWNRVYTVTRQAKGGVGQVATTTTYDDAGGRWKDVSVTADGKTLRTHTTMDAFGRTLSVTAYDANGQVATQQSFIYDGFGQKTAQTPVLTGAMTSWGYETWTYDDQGRVTGHYDRVPTPGTAGGRTLSTTTLQPTWQTLGGVTAIWTTSVDDRGYTRSSAVDLLGQKAAVMDQKGQLSQYFYDADGHLLQTLQSGGSAAQQRSYTYNGMGWMTSRTEPEEGSTTYSAFTMSGTPTVTTQTRASGTRTFTTTLDAHLQPSQVAASGPEGTVTRAFKYDYSSTNTHLLTDLYESQAMTGLATQVLSEAYGYDALGRLLNKTVYDGNDGAIVTPSSYTQAFAVSQTLNDGGQVTSLTYPSGGGKAAQTSTIQYDTQNRPTTVKLDGALRGMMVYGAGSGSSLTNTLIYGNGVQTVSTSTMGDLVQSQFLSGSTVLETDAMTWTAGGLMLSRGPAANPDTFDYDALQRLSHSKVIGLSSETMEQWYTYDGFGNRIQNNFVYTAANGSVQPSEPLAWSIPAYGPGNQLPTSLTQLAPGAPGVGAAGTYSTGAQYDDLGRMTQVWTTPGQASTLTTWIYDPSGRVVKENGTSYLLESSGLRFKRTKTDGTVDYTVYGFGREPLAQFQIPVVKTAAPTRMAMAPMIGGQGAGAYILQPSGPITVGVGQVVTFQGDTDFGTSFLWTFGDGATAATMSTTHAFTTVGTYTVSFKAGDPSYTTSTATVTITVMAKPSITSLTASPGSITSGQSSTLAWSVTGATSLSLDNGIGTVTGTTSRSVSPSVSTTYTLTATNAAGSVTATVTVAVSASAPPTIPSFTATPAILASGQSTTLAWTVTGGASVSISGVGAQSGTSVSVTPAATTSYTLTATNAAGSATATITVRVETALPVITDFWSNPVQITSGQSATLNWAVSQADSLSLDNSIGTVTGSTQTVSPTATTTYKLMATNAVGSVSATVTVSVGTPGSLVWKKTIVYGFGQDLAEDQPGMGTTFIQGDYVGSPSVMTDPSGAVIGKSKNLPFGERYSQTGSKTIRRYTNHEDDADSGAIYMQARENLPAYGKFAQVDPAYDQTKDDPESWNLYNYVTNNPVTHTDPDGRFLKAELDGPSSPSNPHGSFNWMTDTWEDVAWAAYADAFMAAKDAEEKAKSQPPPAPGTGAGGGGTNTPKPGKESKAPSAKTKDSKDDSAQTNSALAAAIAFLTPWAAENTAVAATLMANTWDKTGSFLGLVGPGEHGVGHADVMDPGTGTMLLSQFPLVHQPVSKNTTESALETKVSEGRGPDHSYMVDIKDRGAFARQALTEIGKGNWTPMGIFGTQCTVSTSKSLFAGGSSAMDATPFRWPGSLTQRLETFANIPGSGVTRADPALVDALFRGQ
jgi:RHS repeat-associated protein